MKSSDVIVIGGGPAGCVTSTQLSKAGFDVVQVASNDRRADSPAEILGPNTLRFFETIGFKVPVDKTVQCRGILSRWVSDQEQFSDYDLLDVRRGAVVQRATFHAGLNEWANQSGVRVWIGTTLKKALFNGQFWDCLLANHSGLTRLHARFIVDASGRGGSPIAGRDATRMFADRLVAIATPVCVSESTDFLTIECSANGWWYIPPAIADRTHLVYLTDFDILPTKGQNREEWLIDAFHQTRLLSGMMAYSPDFEQSRLLDARFSARMKIIDKNWACVGDAALALDPLSGHGVDTALNGTLEAVQALIGLLKTKNTSSMESYCAWHIAELTNQRRLRFKLYGQVNPAVRCNTFWQRRAISS